MIPELAVYLILIVNENNKCFFIEECMYLTFLLETVCCPNDVGKLQ